VPAERWRREFIACSAAVDEIACGVPAFTLDISGPRIRPDVSHRIERGWSAGVERLCKTTKFTRCPTGVKCSQVQLQSGSAKYAPTRNDAIVVDAETPCDLVCNGGRGMSQRRNGVP
jgi:hypothetical protein